MLLTIMATTFCSSSTTASFLAIEDLSQAFHRTSSQNSSLCTPPLPDPEAEPEPETDRLGESVIGFGVGDFGLASCTEGLGFESSNMMVSDTCCDCDCCCLSHRISEDYYCRSDSAVGCDSNGRRIEKKRLPVPEKKDFPPPLSSLISENGRRNFTLKPVRGNGRLEIVRISNHRPEILWASRQNGRLRLDLVSNVVDEEENRELSNEKEVRLEASDHNNEEEERENDIGESASAPEEDREWKIPTIRRCYQREVLYAWSQQQNRCVTTI